MTNKLFTADDPEELDFVRRLPVARLLTGHDAFGLFRPVKNALWLVFSALEPFGVEWCHVFAIAIGILSFFPVLAFCRRIFANEWKALAAAAIWLLSPTLVSSAAWLSCINIQVMAASAATAMVCHDSAWDKDRFQPKKIVFACLFLFIAMVSYECAVAVVPILVLFDALLRPNRCATRASRRSYCCYLAVLALYLTLRFLSQSRTAFQVGWAEATRLQLVASSPYFAMQHVASWFWPFGRFSVGGSYVWGEVSGAILVGCAILGIAVPGFALIVRKRRPALSFGIFFAILGLAPVCNCLGLGNGPYGDYYLTLASIGLAIGSVDLVWWFAEAKGRWRLPSLLSAATLALVRAAAVPEAARWAHLWTSSDLAYTEAARNHPDSAQNLSGSLFGLMAEERWDETLAVGNRIEAMAGPDSPKMAGVYYSRFTYALGVTRDRKLAVEMLDRFAAVTDPDETAKQVLFHKGRIFEILDQDAETAEYYYEQALDGHWDVGLVACADRLARLKALRGKLEEAIALWEKARKITPDNVSVLWNLSIAYRDSGEPEKSAKMLEKVRILTGNPDLGK